MGGADDELIPVENLVYANGYEKMYGITEAAQRYYTLQQRRLARFDVAPSCQGGKIAASLSRKLDALKKTGYSPTREDDLFERARVDLVHSTAVLEGSTLSVHEVAMMLERGIVAPGKPYREHIEVSDISDAVDAMVELVDKGVCVNIDSIRKIHAIASRHLDDCEPGELRWNQRYIAGSKVLPPPPKMVPRLLERALAWYDAKPSLERAAGFHLVFEDIHPFQDGNGRVGRIILNQMLMLQGYPMIALKVDEKARAAYYDAVASFAAQVESRDTRAFVSLVQDRMDIALGQALKRAEEQGMSLERDEKRTPAARRVETPAKDNLPKAKLSR